MECAAVATTPKSKPAKKPARPDAEAARRAEQPAAAAANGQAAAVTRAAPPMVHVVDPRGIYFLDDVCRIFRLPASGVRRAIRRQGLRVSRRGGRHVFLGRWLLQWIELGELPRRPMRDKRDNADVAGELERNGDRTER